ncbi:MAG: dTMP kinase [Verrucomicrobiales bacterium]|nr:dTMP kinase [Verrucomicrobiales bacterium]|tara:strand:+ start:2738 stop:3379 length:642 start_codon:yes stop_codon:yes gene_type:complete
MTGLFISFEGTEGGGKSTQIELLANWLREHGHEVVVHREPGGTPIGEEIRHLLKHSDANVNMTPEAELLLMNASRAQLVREVIRPRLEQGCVVLCDRFHDSTVVYQGYGRQLDLESVRAVIHHAVGETQPDITLLLRVPVSVSEERRRAREESEPTQRDRFEEADREFFERVEAGYDQIAASEPERIRTIDATKSVDEIQAEIRSEIGPLLSP